jgi:peptidoglycan hydrolase-like protein with peptidoglycan-binding domain
MALSSNLFVDDLELNACAVSHADHLTQGATGPHVRKIQSALMVLDDAAISDVELDGATYGPTTASAVLAYKKKRNIVNRSYQQSADNIVGIMTINAMDKELLSLEVHVAPKYRVRCARATCVAHGPRRASAVNDLRSVIANLPTTVGASTASNRPLKNSPFG